MTTKTKWNGSKWIRPAKRAALYIRDSWTCVYCNVRIVPRTEKRADTATLDHLLPRELGGGNSVDNLVTCCARCNSSKQDKSVRAFIAHVRENTSDEIAQGISQRIRNAKRRSLTKDLKAAYQELLEKREAEFYEDVSDAQ